MTHLSVGDAAPAFSLPDQHGTLQPFPPSGPAVLFFYPKAITPGCTQESKDFTALAGEFASLGVSVFGISRDIVARQKLFADKEHLTIPLLSDEAGQACEAYGAWGEKKNYGKTYMGIIRSSFLVDKAGKIAAIWPKVSVKGHAHSVLKAARKLA